MKKLHYFYFFFFLLVSVSCSQDDSTIIVEVNPSDVQGANVPVSVAIDLPSRFRNTDVNQISVSLSTSDGASENIPGQLTREGSGEVRLWWVLPETRTDANTSWAATFQSTTDASTPDFLWQDDQGKHLDLIYDGKKVFRYEYELDSQFVLGETLTARNRVFYHLYDLDGTRLITNGYEPGTWSHHRGIMIGWRDVKYQGQRLSFWGMEQLTTQKHIEFVELTAGPVLARVKSRIHWNDSTGQTIIDEIRTATIYHLPSPAIALLDFSSTLTAANGDVSLAGDPEHGGVQYRAHGDVADEKPGSRKPTYYFHKDGIDPTVDHNLPWVGMEYGLDHKTYSIVDMNGEGNPSPAVWSAYRDYGRFGPYFSKDLADGESFDVNFRFFISESEMPSRKEIDAMHASYLNPPATGVN